MEVNPHACGQLIYVKGSKNKQWRKDGVFNKWCWENWTTTSKRMKLEHPLTPHTKINSKFIKDLNIILDTVKLLEENLDIDSLTNLSNIILIHFLEQWKFKKGKTSGT